MSNVGSPALSRMDRFGTIASVACLIHCIATPLVLSMFAVAAPFVPNEGLFHRVLALPVCLIGVFAMWNGFKRHQRMLPTLLMSLGLSLIVGGAFGGERLPSHACEVAITMVGSACMIAAHRINHLCCKACACHGHE